MIKELAVVIKIDGHQVWIERRVSRACGSCRQNTAYSTSRLGGLIGKRAVPVDSEIELKPGDEVLVGVTESLLLRVSLCLYRLPLMALLAGAGIADQMLTANSTHADLGIAGSALSSFLLALWLISKTQHRLVFVAGSKPVVVKKVE